MTYPKEEDIRERAHQLWHDAGCPEDREQEFWYQAEHELKEKAKQPNLPDATG
jgi:Protein of unknown function (DUF2934)